VFVDTVESIANLSVVVRILAAGAFDQCGGESGGRDGNGADDGD
jgi:hypothetical protein